MTQTKREIQALLAAAGARPLKRFGQHFLIDGNLMRKLVSATGVGPSDVVLEVGPGTGALTEELLPLAGHVVAVEIDRTLQTICWDRLGQHPGFTLIAGDVLEKKGAIAPAVRRTLQDRCRALGGRLLLVANLPYQIATPLILNLLTGEPRADGMCFTIQVELADRLQAPPGGKEYGPLGILTQVRADVQRIARVPPEAFWPSPEVESAIIRINVRAEAPAPEPVLRRLSEVVHACFNYRRKTLRWSLRNLVDDAALARIEAAGPWDLTRRPEDLTVEQWLALARLLTD